MNKGPAILYDMWSDRKMLSDKKFIKKNFLPSPISHLNVKIKIFYTLTFPLFSTIWNNVLPFTAQDPVPGCFRQDDE
jgi:hypothetical protein